MKRREVLKGIDEDEALSILYDWKQWARPEQLAPEGDWSVWLIKSGRGWGKTKSAAEFIRDRVETGKARNVALVADTVGDVRRVMVQGISGILACSNPKFMPIYEPSKSQLVWPNGAIATCFTAEAPEALRGPEHDLAWCDEPAKWKNLRKTDLEGGTAWDNLMFGLRQGSAQCVCSTTPRAIKWYKDLLKKSTTVVTGGSSYDNRANLSKAWFENTLKPYEGTRLGRQEINAELIDEVPGALWTQSLIEQNRRKDHPPLVRIIVAIDPEATSSEDSAETGIISAGVDENGEGWVLHDDSLRSRPDGWGKAAVRRYYSLKADRIIAENNNGGEMVEHVIRTVDENVSYSSVHASRGKLTRAEPIAALYEQGRVHHVGGFAELEDQMCSWVPGDKSPDRMDALVWALSELMLGNQVGMLFAE